MQPIALSTTPISTLLEAQEQMVELQNTVIKFPDDDVKQQLIRQIVNCEKCLLSCNVDTSTPACIAVTELRCQVQQALTTQATVSLVSRCITKK